MSKHDPKIEHLATIRPFRRCTRRQLHQLAQLTTEFDAAAARSCAGKARSAVSASSCATGKPP